jgi:hypothetical protein
MASDKVFETCGCKFHVSVITRWNYLFDAIEKVLCHKDKLILTFNDLNFTKLKVHEWVFLEEFCKTMKSLAMSLDRFQNENNGYIGYIAPTILILRCSLIQLILDFKYCIPLTSAIISGLEKRFPYIFDLSTSKKKRLHYWIY